MKLEYTFKKIFFYKSRKIKIIDYEGEIKDLWEIIETFKVKEHDKQK